MNRQELHELQTMSDYPSLSIIVPTLRTAPQNLLDPIRLNNVVTTAKARLLDDFPRREVAPLLERLDFLVEQIDWRDNLDGLALFVNRECAATFDIPFPVTERFVISDTFATRELIFAMNRNPRYHVLVLGEQSTRLFRVGGNHMFESHAAGFPMQQLLPELANVASRDGMLAASRDAYDKAYLQCIDQCLAEAAAQDQSPVIVAGTDHNLNMWRQIAVSTPYIAGIADGYHEGLELPALELLARQAMQRYQAGQRVAALEDLDEAMTNKRYASGIGAVWQTAHDGRCETLLVEKDFRYPAWIHPCGLLLNTITEGSTAEFLDNAVDNIIERVATDGGHVIFMDNGTLDSHFHISAVLRS